LWKNEKMSLLKWEAISHFCIEEKNIYVGNNHHKNSYIYIIYTYGQKMKKKEKICEKRILCLAVLTN
jgi:hypothetical protein